MKVWVVMSNDYPDSVFASEAAAEKYVEEKRGDPENKRKYGGLIIHYRAYEFEVRQ